MRVFGARRWVNARREQRTTVSVSRIAGALLALLCLTPGKALSEPAGIDGLWIRSIVVSPDGAHIYAAGGLEGRAIAVFERDAASGEPSFVEVVMDGLGDVDGLGGVQSVTLSPDGAHLYAASEADDAVAAFARDASTGALTFVAAYVDGSGAIDGLDGAQSVAVSPDGAHVYATGAADNSVVVFERHASTGALSFVQVQRDGVAGVTGLGGAEGVALSPDGAHLYVASQDDGAVTAFGRNSSDGTLSFVGTYLDSFGYPDPSIVMSPDGRHLYVSGSSGPISSARPPKIKVFTRDTGDGTLSLVEIEEGDPNDQFPPALALSPDGAHLYASGARFVASSFPYLALYDRDPVTGALSQASGSLGHRFPTESVAVSPDGDHVYIGTWSSRLLPFPFGGAGDERKLSSLVTASRDPDSGLVTVTHEQSDVATAEAWFHPEEYVPPPVRLLLKELPMSRQRYLIKWTGKSDTAIFDDPRCNGDPSGTVKAYVRFFSPSLGRDTGPIPLPCDGWTVVPRADSPTGHRERFKYVDRRYVYGPCNQVVAENGRKLKVTCNGSMGYADFRYDLEAGTSEETVCAALRIGAGKFVTRFRGVASRDGSDGERFDGVWEPVPFDEPNACDLPESLP